MASIPNSNLILNSFDQFIDGFSSKASQHMQSLQRVLGLGKENLFL